MEAQPTDPHPSPFGPIVRAAMVGTAAGLRSAMPPAVVYRNAKGPLPVILAVMAAGEVIADKLPQTPARTFLPALVFRAVTAGISGREVAVRNEGNAAAGIAVAAIAAVASTYAGFGMRMYLAEATALPDFVIAALEDGFTFLLAYGADAAP
jgi:uncharacterized membrane protein